MTPSDEIKTGDLVRWEYGEGPCAGPDNWVEGTLVAPGYLAKIEVSQCGLGTRAGRTMSFGTFGSATLRRITRVTTPVGDIRVTADPTLKPDELVFKENDCSVPASARVYRLPNGEIGVGPDQTPIGMRWDECGVFHVDRSPPAIDWAKLRKSQDSDPYMFRTGPAVAPKSIIGLADFIPSTAPFAGVDRSAPVQSLKVATRPDGFDQGRIDAIKADMLAVGRRR